MYSYSRIVLTLAAMCIAEGGLYDVFAPRLPPNLTAKCSGVYTGVDGKRKRISDQGRRILGVEAVLCAAALMQAKPLYLFPAAAVRDCVIVAFQGRHQPLRRFSL